MKRDLYFVGVFLFVIWLIYIVDAIIPYALNDWGVVPRTVTGLVGIPLMPFLHGGFYHVLTNTISLGILLTLLVGLQRNHWPIVAAIGLGNGMLVWVFARPGSHIGASGLVFGLIGFLIVNGVLRKRPVAIGVAILVGFLFGGTLISGVIPRIGSQVSWEGHLLGALAGAFVAYALAEDRKLMAWR